MSAPVTVDIVSRVEVDAATGALRARDGGPAFPRLVEIVPSSNDTIGGGITGPQEIRKYDFPGMSLRDWFAGQALAGICANSALGDRFTPIDLRINAEAAYSQADAMLADRGELK